MASKGHKLLAAGTAVLIAEPVLALAHTGGLGVIVGLAIGAVAYNAVEDIEKVTGRDIPSLPLKQKRPSSGQPSLAYRLLNGKSTRTLQQGDASAEAETEQEERPARMEMRREEEGILLAADVCVKPEDVIGKAIFVCGIRRHGKTTLGARLAEQLGKHYIPLFIPDLEGDYVSLADVLPRAVIAGHSSVDEQYPSYEFVALETSEAAYSLGYDILEYGYQVILDMASYSKLDPAIAIQVNIIRGMFHWANTHPDSRVPSHVFLDEAQRYLPQTLSDSMITDKALLGELLRCYMDIIAIGGKRGIAPVILTQRFAQVNKKIMAQSEVFFLMKQTNDGDLDRCLEYVNAPITKEQIAKFRPGQGVYLACDGTQLVTQFFQRESSGERSCTPRAVAARRYAQMKMPIHDVHHSPGLPLVEHTTQTFSPGNVNAVNAVNGLGKPVNEGEYSPTTKNGTPAFTPAEETHVLLASAELLKQDKPVTRTGIRDYLGWDNKQYQRVIKPVCDKHRIASKEA